MPKNNISNERNRITNPNVFLECALIIVLSTISVLLSSIFFKYIITLAPKIRSAPTNIPSTPTDKLMFLSKVPKLISSIPASFRDKTYLICLLYLNQNTTYIYYSSTAYFLQVILTQLKERYIVSIRPERNFDSASSMRRLCSRILFRGVAPFTLKEHACSFNVRVIFFKISIRARKRRFAV